eukprot:8870250-Prorocentrum_lima.AAC.1
MLEMIGVETVLPVTKDAAVVCVHETAMGKLVSPWRRVQWKKPGRGMWRLGHQPSGRDAGARTHTGGDRVGSGEMGA